MSSARRSARRRDRGHRRLRQPQSRARTRRDRRGERRGQGSPGCSPGVTGARPGSRPCPQRPQTAAGAQRAWIECAQHLVVGLGGRRPPYQISPKVWAPPTGGGEGRGGRRRRLGGDLRRRAARTGVEHPAFLQGEPPRAAGRAPRAPTRRRRRRRRPRRATGRRRRRRRVYSGSRRCVRGRPGCAAHKGHDYHQCHDHEQPKRAARGGVGEPVIAVDDPPPHRAEHRRLIEAGPPGRRACSARHARHAAAPSRVTGVSIRLAPSRRFNRCGQDSPRRSRAVCARARSRPSRRMRRSTYISAIVPARIGVERCRRSPGRPPAGSRCRC